MIALGNIKSKLLLFFLIVVNRLEGKEKNNLACASHTNSATK
jgi:hypothetical protein